MLLPELIIDKILDYLIYEIESIEQLYKHAKDQSDAVYYINWDISDGILYPITKLIRTEEMEIIKKDDDNEFFGKYILSDKKSAFLKYNYKEDLPTKNLFGRFQIKKRPIKNTMHFTPFAFYLKFKKETMVDKFLKKFGIRSNRITL